jgi:hypothetical protein
MIRDTIFKTHTTNNCPVKPDLYVVYRTTSEDNDVSHIHLPVQAKLLNWSSNITNRILHYSVVELTERGEEKLHTTGIQDEPEEVELVIELILEEENV